MQIKHIIDAQLDGRPIIEMVIDHETGPVVKRWAVIGTLADKIGTAHQREHRYKLLKRWREAERDIAYRMFGDDWGKHVTRGLWSAGPPNEPEVSLLKQAMHLRPDLFGDVP